MKIFFLIVMVNGSQIAFRMPFKSKADCQERVKKIEKGLDPGDSFDFHCFEDTVSK